MKTNVSNFTENHGLDGISHNCMLLWKTATITKNVTAVKYCIRLVPVYYTCRLVNTNTSRYIEHIQHTLITIQNNVNMSW